MRRVRECDFSIGRFEDIAIVGLGVIGGSIGGALMQKGFENVWGIDIDQGIIDTGVKRGLVSGGSTDAGEIIPKADLVIICLYPHDTVEFIKSHMDLFKKGAVITDVSGIKEGLIDQVESIMRPDLEFVGGHPMAGSESQGVSHASASMFKGANYIITPCKSNTKRAIMKVEALARQIGCTNITRLSPGEHDRAIAFTSHMPHIVALALMSMGSPECLKDFMGSSFKDATRVAQINSRLWGELFMENKENVAHQIQKMQESMEAIKQAIINSDESELEKIMDTARARRGEIC